MTLTLTVVELAAVVMAAVGLAATDASALSRVWVAWLAKRLGVEPAEIRATDAATDGDGGTQ
ncbi:hypothetical protein C475_17818 [Halosimplex carlsbadense 2-9-1]|uniref:Uncharacterized protein n=1 Tax=Halosimplex carlsbadense 2-9-1 TaxID=797114 RepID=M0CKJ2_9EURY|nr:hypothetical protein [Halosimplex carlsbadense]ELZ22394.1 hypothetical protein C475_17818 [Halosimplex carlsbadense 2-9-1]